MVRISNFVIKITLLFIFCFLIKLIHDKCIASTRLSNIFELDSENYQNNERNTVKIFDLTKELKPNSTYNSIFCRKSLYIHVTTTLCIHEIWRDVHVSGTIISIGVWEPQIIIPFIDYLVKNPDWLVLDIGAHIGQYSLYAAQLGRNVVTVEPFHDNILRIHKAAKIENIANRITLIKNALYIKRGDIKMLKAVTKDNLGSQSLLQHKNKSIKKEDIKANDPMKKYYVETILFDDIIPYLPLNNDKKNYKKAILKIDIEGFEPYAFQSAHKLFEILEIPIIFMEWGNLRQQQQNMNVEIEQMLDFLYSKGYKIYENEKLLNRHQWRSWPWDVILKKDGYL